MSNELIVNNENFIPDLFIENNSVYSSIDINEDINNKIVLFNAINNSDGKISDFINKEIVVKNVYCDCITIDDMMNEDTFIDENGEIHEEEKKITLPRIVLIDNEGHSYRCASLSVLNSLKRIFDVFGFPPFIPPIVIKPVQVKTKKGYTALSLQPVRFLD